MVAALLSNNQAYKLSVHEREFLMRNLTRPTFGSILIAMVILAFVIPLALFSSQVHQTHAASSSHPARPITGTPIDWPEFHADAARDGAQSGNTQLTKANANTLVPVTGAAYTTTGAAIPLLPS